MKNFFIIFALLFTFLACSDDVGGGEQSPNVTINESVENMPKSISGGNSCSFDEYRYVNINGKYYWVRVPTLCDTKPYIYKGDPVPDVSNPVDDLVLKEKILNSFNNDISKEFIK